MRKLTITTMSLVLGLAVYAPGCTHHDKSSSASEGKQPVHAVQGQQLRDTMHQLAAQTAYTPAGKLPPDPESNKAVDPKVYDDAATLAASLSKTAAQIPTSKGSKQLTGSARTEFEKEAMTLQRHAMELESAAKAHRVEGMQRAFDDINASCIACHSRFRDFAGQLDFGRAEAPASNDIAAIAGAAKAE